MNIVVCIKQVPGTNEVKINRETNTIIREGIESIINPFDNYAIEEALRIKERTGGKVIVISMGIPSVTEQLREALALGADEAYLLSDRAFAGSDSLATSYALSKGIKKLGTVDLILCGKQASDGDTAQVGPGLAEKLDLPHTTYVRKIEELNENRILCNRMTDDGYERVELPLPAVITVVKEINEPRLPSLNGVLTARNKEITVWTAEDVGAERELSGLTGSPTQVVRTFVPEHHIHCEVLEGTPDEKVKQLVERLVSHKLINLLEVEN